MYVIVSVELHITYDTDDYRLQVDPANTRINDVCMTFGMTIDTYLRISGPVVRKVL